MPIKAFEAMAEKEVDLLIGLNMNHIMPEGGTGVNKVGGISVKKTKFGTGWVVGGMLEDQSRSGVCGGFVSNLITTKAALVRSAKLQIVPGDPIVPEFWESDQLGVRVPPKCDRCRKCQQTGMCSEAHAQHTAKDQAELDLIRSKTKRINGEIWCEYPFVKDPSCLSNNRASAVKVAEKVFRDLKRDNLLEQYHDCLLYTSDAADE